MASMHMSTKNVNVKKTKKRMKKATAESPKLISIPKPKLPIV